MLLEKYSKEALMPKRCTPVKTTKAQREALAEVRTSLAELGYLISPVADWYRKHGSEFIALPKDRPQEFVLVRPQRHGRILIRPFGAPTLYQKIREFASKMKSKGVGWRSQQLKYATGREDWWVNFIPQGMRKELSQSIYALSLEAKPPLM